MARLFFLIINKDINIKYTLFTSYDDLLCEKAPTSLVQVSECGRGEVGVIAMLVLSGGPNTSHCQLLFGLVIVWSCHEQPDQGEGQLFLYEQHQGRTETEKTKRGGVGQVRVESHQSNGPLITREGYSLFGDF